MRSGRLRMHRGIDRIGYVHLLRRAAAVPDAGGGGVWAPLVVCEKLDVEPAAHGGRA